MGTTREDEMEVGQWDYPLPQPPRLSSFCKGWGGLEMRLGFSVYTASCVTNECPVPLSYRTMIEGQCPPHV